MNNADIGVEPIYIGHESIMLRLHQSAYIVIVKSNGNPKGIRTPDAMVKTLCLNH